MFSWRMHLSVQLSSKDLLRLYLILVNVIFGWLKINLKSKETFVGSGLSLI